MYRIINKRKSFKVFKRLVVFPLALLVVVATLNMSALASEEQGGAETQTPAQASQVERNLPTWPAASASQDEEGLQIPGHLSARDRAAVEQLGVVPWFLDPDYSVLARQSRGLQPFDPLPFAPLSAGSQNFAPFASHPVGAVFWQLSTNQVPYPVPTGPAGDHIDITFRLMEQTAGGPVVFTNPIEAIQLSLDFPFTGVVLPPIARALTLAPEAAPHPIPNIRWGQQMIDDIPGLDSTNMVITTADWLIPPPQGNTSSINFVLQHLLVPDPNNVGEFVPYSGVIEFTARFMIGNGFIPNPDDSFRLGVFRPIQGIVLPTSYFYQTEIIRVCPCDLRCLGCDECLICEVTRCPCYSGLCIDCCGECDGLVIPGPDRDPTLPPRVPSADFAIQWVPNFDFGRHQLGTATTFNVLPAVHPTNTVDDGSGNQVPAVLHNGDHFVSINNLVEETPQTPPASPIPSPGWRLTVDMATEFIQQGVPGNHLTNASIIFNKNFVATGFVGSPGAPTNVVMTSAQLPSNMGPAALPTSPPASPPNVISFAGPAILVAEALPGEAEGQVAINMGGNHIGTNEGQDIQLRAPERASHRAARFTADLHWVLTAGPPAGGP